MIPFAEGCIRGHPLQLVYGIVGVLIVALALRPSMRGHCLRGGLK